MKITSGGLLYFNSKSIARGCSYRNTLAGAVWRRNEYAILIPLIGVSYIRINGSADTGSSSNASGRKRCGAAHKIPVGICPVPALRTIHIGNDNGNGGAYISREVYSYNRPWFILVSACIS